MAAESFLGDDVVSHQCMQAQGLYRQRVTKAQFNVTGFVVQDRCDLEKSCARKEQRDSLTENDCAWHTRREHQLHSTNTSLVNIRTASKALARHRLNHGSQLSSDVTP